jgi:hypothetical protein
MKPKKGAVSWLDSPGACSSARPEKPSIVLSRVPCCAVEMLRGSGGEGRVCCLWGWLYVCVLMCARLGCCPPWRCGGGRGAPCAASGETPHTREVWGRVTCHV